MGEFNIKRASELWRTVHSTGIRWTCPDEVMRIAAVCGLGVLSVKARDYATELVRASFFRRGRGYDYEMYYNLPQTNPGFPLHWARHLREAAAKFPVTTTYPISEPANHFKDGLGCFGSARKGPWSDECYRAAWGNVAPFGLAVAEKACPLCGDLMSYWCWGRNGDPTRRWVVDHVMALKENGCGCHFNLQALHPGCNSSKGGR